MKKDTLAPHFPNYSLSLTQEAAMIKTDRKPFVEWYDESAERVFRFLCARLSSTEDAQDLTSQTFLKAWQAYPNLKRPERFIPWVFTIARNLANDQYRRKKPLALPLDESAPDPQANPVDDAIKNQFRTRLRELVAELKEDERELLYLRYQADLNFREIAQVVRRSESAIKKQHLRLLARLQSQMELENE